MMAGLVVILIDCGNYAIAKGDSGLLGILEIGSIVGLVILIHLSDTNKWVLPPTCNGDYCIEYISSYFGKCQFSSNT